MRRALNSALVLFMLAFVLGIGVAVPRLSSNGVADLPAELQSIGNEAATLAAMCIDNPIQRLYTFRLRVASVEHDASCPAPGLQLNGYRAAVGQLTFFGVSFGSITVCGASANCA